MATQGIENWKL